MIMSPLEGPGPDICLASGFFPREKLMTLTGESQSRKILDTRNASLFKSSKTYYYAGFTQGEIQTCEMDGKTQTKNKMEEKVTNPLPVVPVSSVQMPCPINSSGLLLRGNGNPKANTISLLFTGLRVLLAKCVGVNVLLTVKALLV
ncbi:hypothetical protein DNTS_029918 [Danionella cerebrum]|uniref:Uncharacterized protein n=1 Tax=Danionella cerebrum TaxID=2873325 RepID=A0A553RPW7_9TELE|nr:hypothetical protein DNTS_029918 [Danionella translucida]